MRSLSLLLLSLLPSVALADDELITLQSSHSAAVTVQRLQEAFKADGWTIFATLDQAAQAAEFGIKMPARTTIIVACMSDYTMYLLNRLTMAIDGPLRVLVWEDGEGVWVTRNTLRYQLQHVVYRHEAKGLGNVPPQTVEDKSYGNDRPCFALNRAASAPDGLIVGSSQPAHRF